MIQTSHDRRLLCVISELSAIPDELLHVCFEQQTTLGSCTPALMHDYTFCRPALMLRFDKTELLLGYQLLRLTAMAKTWTRNCVQQKGVKIICNDMLIDIFFSHIVLECRTILLITPVHSTFIKRGPQMRNQTLLQHLATQRKITSSITSRANRRRH